MKKIYLIHLLLAYSSLFNILKAQEKTSGAQLTLEEKDYCFGIVEESEKSYSHNFKFTNTGTEPLIISNVTTSCGCDVPTWPAEVFMPGESGVINYKYLSEGRPGTFTKTMTITCNAKESAFVIYICGYVYSKDEAKPESFNCNCIHAINPNEKIANIQFEEKEYSFGLIKTQDYIKHSFKFVNTGNAPLIFSSVRSSCGCDKATMPKEPILPGESGIITYTYDANRIGAFTKSITVVSNAKDSIIVLTVCGNVYKAETGIPKQSFCYCGAKKTKSEENSIITFNSVDSFNKLRMNDISTFIQNKKLEIQLYPNPAVNLVKIEGQDIIIDKLIIFDSNGKVVKQVINTDRISTLSIDIANLANGFYNVKSYSKENIYENKLIIAR